jgi:hypothetical protein
MGIPQLAQMRAPWGISLAQWTQVGSLIVHQTIAAS